MSKLVIFDLGKGTLQDGFSYVTVQLREDGKDKWWQFKGSLPAAPIILDRYRRWQLLYQLLYQSLSINTGLRQPQVSDEDITFDEVDVTHVSRTDFKQICQQLQNEIDSWLDTENFRHIDRKLRRQLSQDDAIRVIIQTEDNNLRKIPWHLWRFFEDYPKAEVALSALDVEPVNQAKNSAKQVRVLVILGDSTGIDIQADSRELKNLPDTKLEFLVEPQRWKLDEHLRNEQGWDILFFAGHGSTQANGETGYIHINPNEKLTIEQLKYALVNARDSGLQFAIFNSCDGLGLAQQLDDLHIPQIIVMREPVPDRVAQKFLKYFLKEFVKGNPFYLAVREARQCLQGIESEFPGASWLPMICQNPTEVPPTWKELRDKKKDDSQPIPIPPPLPPQPKPKLKTALVASVVVTSLLMGMRWLGTFEPLELPAYDTLMRLRSSIPIDDRVVVVEGDGQDMSMYGHPLVSDAIVAQIVEKLEQYQPIAIGLDIVRPDPVPPGHDKILASFNKHTNFIASSFVGSPTIKSIRPPIEFSKKQLKEQVGFTDGYQDYGDNIIRRQVLWMKSKCDDCSNSPYAFSLLLGNKYFEQKGKKLNFQNRELLFGTTLLKGLASHTVGYQHLTGTNNEILLNFRPLSQEGLIAKAIKFRDVLGGSLDPKDIRGKIIIIGITDPLHPDQHKTPYNGEMRGLWLNTHMVSAILSAVEGDRKQLWVLPQWGNFQWGDTLWVWLWSLTGGLLAFRIRSRLYLGLASCSVIWLLYEICLVILESGGWMPLIPSVLSFSFTLGWVVIDTASQTQPH